MIGRSNRPHMGSAPNPSLRERALAKPGAGRSGGGTGDSGGKEGQGQGRGDRRRKENAHSASSVRVPSNSQTSKWQFVRVPLSPRCVALPGVSDSTAPSRHNIGKHAGYHALCFPTQDVKSSPPNTTVRPFARNKTVGVILPAMETVHAF